MIEIKKEDLNNLRYLFNDIRFYMGNSVLDGKMGKAYADDIKNPKFAFLIVRNYCFISGRILSDKFKSIIEEYGLYEYKIIPNDELKSILEDIYGKRLIKSQRYSIKKNTVFNTDKLKYFTSINIPEFEFIRINSKMAKRIEEEQFIKITDEYENNGIGYCCIKNNEIIGVATSNIIYNDGIEVNIKVKESYRRKGIATILASKLILACIEENKNVSWDAANLNSVGLAEKLGFEYDSTYDVYNIE